MRHYSIHGEHLNKYWKVMDYKGERTLLSRNKTY